VDAKNFYNQNEFKEGTIIRLGVDEDLTTYIYIMEIKI